MTKQEILMTILTSGIIAVILNILLLIARLGDDDNE